ncbi:MAG: MFS transporter [Chloroflexi bacterium]|nr:MFS transporter [Chloroflexota bacterium]
MSRQEQSPVQLSKSKHTTTVLLQRRYAVGAVVFLANTLVVGGVLLTFGLFVEPLEAEFGWNRAEISGALTSALLVSFFMAPIGAVADRIGARTTMVGSMLIVAAAFALRPFMTELWHFYALTATAAIGLPGATALATDRLVSSWFAEKRGRALALTGAGNQVGGLTVLPAIALVVSISGWETGAFLISAAFVIAALVAFMLVRNPKPSDIKGQTDRTAPDVPLSGALRSVAFYSLMGVFVSSAMTEMVIFPQLIPHLQNEGLSDGAATTGLVVVSFSGLPGKIILGRLAEIWTGRRTLVISMSLIMLGTLLLALGGGSFLLWPGVALFGAGFGALGVLYALAITELFGLRAYGSILGAFKSVTALAVLPIPPLAGIVFEITGSYQLILFLGTAMAAIGIPMLLLARPSTKNDVPIQEQPISAS